MDLSTDPAVPDRATAPQFSDSAPGSATPDILCAGLDLVLACPFNSQPHGAETMFANAGNRFWPTAHEAGLIPRRYSANTISRLPEIGMGVLFLPSVDRDAGTSGKAKVSARDITQFNDKLLRFRPRACAFVGKHSASIWLQRSPARLQYGRQPQRRDGIGCEIFVLPPTMTSARRYWNAEPWHQLASWIADTRPWRF
ncbi:mismatch-specific DNA-glycosylase [Hyphomicrobium sulfonivorans]|uniref:mismatch-specific DNA-glycosylase n=1 Tax=Hyphomicrobium sulfonivorans TaxID=121290 RepID=UPI00156F5E82|nr:mismatch-specific DNA-glycosylase [Hyphomicrobium sulfonivorans]MBI1649988.1 mismatch-specific DNA-glycosylase [Hyphomicrobium sulfonivorans]NSL72906.1 hypothetical protein [Hyphomicrobium sulfonivorans]